MKKVLAIILSIAMLFGVLAINTFAETTADPKVTLITNEGSPVEKGVDTYFTVKFENYGTVKAFDVVIEAPASITLEAPTTTGLQAGTSNTENVNYTLDNDGSTHSIRFVDLTVSGQQPKIVFAAQVDKKATVEGNPVITVEGKYATSGTNLVTFAEDEGIFELKQEIAPDTVEVPDNAETADDNLYKLPASTFVDTAKQFVPYGSVYKKDGDKIVFAEKDTNGNFIADGNYEVKAFDIPGNGITTFGVSENEKDSTTVRFGNYSNTYTEGKTYGTMVFEGDWLALKNYYIQKGYTVQQLLDAIYTNYDNVIGDKDYVYYTIGENRINVYKFGQKNYMWKSESGKVLEYALRITDLDPTQAYAAAAYSYVEPDKTNFEVSENVQYVPAASAQ